MIQKNIIQNLDTTKLLRIGCVAAAVLIAIPLILPAFTAGGGDSETEEIFTMPTAIENFKNASGSRSGAAQNAESPLVKQAVKFANYLDPPRPKRPQKLSKSNKTIHTVPEFQPSMRPEQVNTRFELLGTSLFSSDPNHSMALIDEPGKGLHWVRQSEKVGHLLIKEVKSGRIVIQDGDQMRELAVKRPKYRSLVKKSSMDTAGANEPSLPSSIGIATVEMPDGRSAKTVNRGSSTRRSISRPRSRQDEEAIQLMKQLVEKMKTQRNQRESSSSTGALSEERKKMLEQFGDQLKANRVSSDEAKKLEDLGKKLEKKQNDPNRTEKDSD